MLFRLTVLLCILNAVMTIITFVLYVKARMANREEQPDHQPEEHARRVAALDKLEQKYKSIHFITLALFVLFGVLILVQITDHID